AANAAAGQSVTGSLSGTVVDDSHKVVPGAAVTLIHETTRAERQTVTNEVGDFLFAGLVPGPYTVKVHLQGFREILQAGNIVLGNGRTAVGQLKLQLGELTEVISVTAVGEQLKTTTTSHQAVLDLKQVTNLSIRGRDPISLLKILPGVQLQANDQETFGGSFATGVPAIQSSRTGGQTFTFEGANGGDGGGSGGGGGNFSGATNLDAIAEVNVQMASFAAGNGLRGGARGRFI